VAYDVTKVRKESVKVDGRTHEHIIGVITSDNAYHPNQEVVTSIKAGNVWQTSVPGEKKAKIREMIWCPTGSCTHKPYLTTNPDHTERNNLENLPRG
jgi:hypothetical protein